MLLQNSRAVLFSNMDKAADLFGAHKLQLLSNKWYIMSTLPLLFTQNYRRNSMTERPHKVGGAYSLNLGQLQGPFLDKDYHLQNKKSISMLTTRSFHTRRYSSDSHRITSATYTSFSKHLAYIPEESFQIEDAQSFRADSAVVQNEIRVCQHKIAEVKQEAQQVRKEIQDCRTALEEQLNHTEESIMRGFKELRTKLFDFSRHDNNTHLSLAKREAASFQETLRTLKMHYEYADKKLIRLQQQFKGKEKQH